tara:strand:+ start:15909 stop:16658 length:750 start_codon:yes stop_codon:yes gene_type:complete
MTELPTLAFEITQAQYGIILLGSFLATLLGSLLGLGGGFIALAVLSAIFPLTIAIPLLAAVLAGIDISRAIAFRKHIYHSIVTPFAMGAVIGVVCGSLLFLTLSEKIIGTGLSILILGSLFGRFPQLKWPLRQQFFYLGSVHAFLSTMFGFGGLLQAAVIKTKLHSFQITGTLAASFLILEVYKIVSYTAGGFTYTPYLLLIAIVLCGSLPASYLGKKWAPLISQNLYRGAQKVIITLIALNIFYHVWL